MSDPLAQVVGLLRPSASFSKLVTASGRWSVRPPRAGPFYGVILEGGCELAIAGREPIRLNRGDFMLVPTADYFCVSSLEGATGGCFSEPIEIGPGVFHLGRDTTPDTRMLIGHCSFESNDAALLVSLLPELAVVRGKRRLMMLVNLLSEEACAERPGRAVVLAHLLQVMLIEAFRGTAGTAAAAGLLRGLADERIALALRRMHAEPTRPWTVRELAKEAAMSRSTFFDRFRTEVGVSPMEYLLNWRMAIAKSLLLQDGARVGEVAQCVGYRTSSTFSVAFARQVGTSPAMYARKHAKPQRGTLDAA